MIKKMYAMVFKSKFKNISEQEECVIAMKTALNEDCKIKPVWVSDKDPLENVREQLKIHKEVGDNTCVNCEHFADAIEEDLKNFDEGAG